MNYLLKNMYLMISNQVMNEEGQDLVEYALMIVLVALACVAGINSVASAINTIFSNISATLS
jgi:pilus assembly protein Flp/PilA